MPRVRSAERKPLSFSTTMRNPGRIAGCINCLIPFEGMILTSEIIHKVIKKVIGLKLYETMYQKKNSNDKNIFNSESLVYSDSDLEDIIVNSPQKHKEAGFNYGWDSRFDTWYKLPMEFGFIYYEMNKPIQISKTGHMLIDAYNEQSINDEKIQNVLLNALMKYQSNNPFRKNSNSNNPLLLLLNVLKLLKQDSEENDAGVYRKELSLFICWNNNDANELYNYIKNFRKNNKYNYSDEFMYEHCLRLLGANNSQRTRFKLSQICGEAVDEYIRKMRCTGVISLRGNGRFIDINSFEKDKIKYIVDSYSEYPIFLEKDKYYEDMGDIDSNILTIQQSNIINISDIRKKKLYECATNYSKEFICKELLNVCQKKECKDELLKFIDAPIRLEFLTSIALVQNFSNLDVIPNYSIDDEGLPKFTAAGGIADIVCYDEKFESLFEVTLMQGRQDQIHNEIIPISRHLKQELKNFPNCFSVLVAPTIHEDTIKSAQWINYSDDVNILCFNINDFILKIQQISNLSEFLCA